MRADPAKVWQVLFNLLSNSRKFTEPGGKVAVECRAEEDHIVVLVRDTGWGIEPAKFNEIFEPFVQADPVLTRRGGGVGLGLAVSRLLARGMGGNLMVATTFGEGCTFTLLPAAAD